MGFFIGKQGVMEVSALVLEGLSRTEYGAEPYSPVLLLSSGLRKNDRGQTTVFKKLMQGLSGEQMKFARLRPPVGSHSQGGPGHPMATTQTVRYVPTPFGLSNPFSGLYQEFGTVPGSSTPSDSALGFPCMGICV